jgi:acyl-CoA synthetase (AMP-forming)/AMP-acid ligase II
MHDEDGWPSLSGAALRLSRRCGGWLQGPGDSSRRAIFEKRRDRKLAAGAFQDFHADGFSHQRVAADVEEIVIGADLIEEVAAFVVLRSSAQPQDILAYCRSKLHPDKQPRQIFIVDALPRNANGKLVKRELVERLPPR